MIVEPPWRDATGRDVREKRPDQRPSVDAAVLVELLVLDREDRVDHGLGNLRELDGLAVLLGLEDGHDRAVGGVHDGALGQRVQLGKRRCLDVRGGKACRLRHDCRGQGHDADAGKDDDRRESEKGAGGTHSPSKLPAALAWSGSRLLGDKGRSAVTRRYRAPMAHAHPFRFGVQASAPMSGKEWSELAQRIEDLGYSTLTMPDHFGDQLAPMPALMAAAAATTVLRVGALVWDNDYKHPVVLAKELATMDLLSDGRLEVGIGAGWMRADYDWSGIPYDPPGVRVDRFEEGLAVIKGHFADGPFSFSGQHYTDQRARRPAPSRCSRPSADPRSAAAASASCRSPPARPTSSASTARWPPARSAPKPSRR